MRRFYRMAPPEVLVQANVAVAVIMAAVAAMAATAANADSLSTYYGNTLIGKTVGGRIARASISRDGTFVGKSPEGTAVKGRWKAQNGQLCFTAAVAPPNQSQPVCIGLEPHNIGDTWTVNDGRQTWSVTLQPGS